MDNVPHGRVGRRFALSLVCNTVGSNTVLRLSLDILSFLEHGRTLLVFHTAARQPAAPWESQASAHELHLE
jgi:hypothetical protein